MKYIVTSEVWAGELELEYDSSDRLINMQVRAQFTEAQHELFLKRIPVHKADISILKTDYTRIKEVAIDLSFENFWRLYNNKEGKHEAEKVWNALPMREQLAAIIYIPVYNGKLAQTTIPKRYPAVYLRKKTWIT